MVALEEAQGIVDLVGDSRRELADGRELLLLDHDALGPLQLHVRLGQLEVGLPQLALVLDPLADVLDDALELHDLALRTLDRVGGLEAEDGFPAPLREDYLVVRGVALLPDPPEQGLPILGIEGEGAEGMPDDVALLLAREREAGRVYARDDVLGVGGVDHVAGVLEEGAQAPLARGEARLRLLPNEIRSLPLDPRADDGRDSARDRKQRLPVLVAPCALGLAEDEIADAFLYRIELRGDPRGQRGPEARDGPGPEAGDFRSPRDAADAVPPLLLGEADGKIAAREAEAVLPAAAQVEEGRRVGEEEVLEYVHGGHVGLLGLVLGEYPEELRGRLDPPHRAASLTGALLFREIGQEAQGLHDVPDPGRHVQEDEEDRPLLGLHEDR